MDNSSGKSERLAAQIIIHEGFDKLDPTHPLGGPDGGKDSLCIKDDKSWIMAVYFPRGQKSIRDIKVKFNNDLSGAKQNSPHGLVFVTNQELRLSERESFVKLAEDNGLQLIIFHLEKITTILDTPEMYGVRHQFLNISIPEQIHTELKVLLLFDQNLQQLQLFNKCRQDISIYGTSFDNEIPSLCEPRLIYIDTHYYLFTAKLKLDVMSKIGNNSERHFPFKIYLQDYLLEKHIANFILLITIKNGEMSIHTQQMGIIKII